MDSTCPKCLTEDSVDDASDGNLTCFVCGHVVEVSHNIRQEVDMMTNGSVTRACGALVSQTSTGVSMSTSVARGNGSFRPTSFHGCLPNAVLGAVERICGQMCLNNRLQDEMRFKYFSIDTSIKYTRYPEVFAASIAYIVLRQNGQAFTLLDLSCTIGRHVFLVGRVFTAILTHNKYKLGCDKGLQGLLELDPTAYFDRILATLVAKDVELESNKSRAKSFAMQIINTIKHEWLTTGRKNDAIAVAAMSIGLELSDVKIIPTFYKTIFNKMCEELKVATSTVRLRIKEIKKALLARAFASVPWARGLVNVKNIHLHLVKILEQLARVERALKSAESPTRQIEGSGSPSSPATSLPVLQLEPSSPSVTPSVTPPTTPSPSLAAPVPSPSVATPAQIDDNKDLTDNLTNFTSVSDNTDKGDIKEDTKNDVKISPPAPYETSYSLPPAFVAAVEGRDRRKRMINSAVVRLRVDREKDPKFFDEGIPWLKEQLDDLSATVPLPLLPPKLSPSSPSSPSPPSSSPSSPHVPTTPQYPNAPRYQPPTSPRAEPGTFNYEALLEPKEELSPLSSRRKKKPVLREAVKAKTEKLAKPDIVNHEALVIERLLVNGVHPDVIIEGFYEAERALPGVQHSALNSEKLGEEDIPDSDMDQYIRSQEEVQIISGVSVWHDKPAKQPRKKYKKRKTSHSDSDNVDDARMEPRAL